MADLVNALRNRVSRSSRKRVSRSSRRSSLLLKLTVSALSMLCFSTTPLLAQTQVRILEPTERISAQILDGERVRKLVGQVRLEIDGRIISCDSAFQYLERPLVIGFNVGIQDERDEIRADTLRFNTRTEIGTFTGNVKIRQEGSTVWSQIAEMNLETSDAHFIGQVQWMDSTRYVEADEGFVDRDSKTTRLKGRVYGEEPDEGRWFAADSMIADSTGFSSFEGQVWMMMIEKKAESGNAVDLNIEADNEPAEDNNAADDVEPAVNYQTTAEADAVADTTILTSTLVKIWDTTDQERLLATGQTAVWSTRLSSISDTLDQDRISGLYRLLGDPIVWKNDLQLSSEWIEALIEDQNILSLMAGPRPVLVMEDSVTGRLHQMTGDTLQAAFLEGELSELKLSRQTEVLFHRSNAEKEPAGAMKMTTSGPIRLTFLDGEIQSIDGKDGIDGLYLDEDEQPEGLSVTGFRWDPEKRPAPSQGPERRFSELYRIFQQQKLSNP